MKKFTLFGALAAIFAMIFLIGSHASSYAYPSGAPAGYTGSPGDAQNCKNCHGGSQANVTNWITSNIPSSGYVPGTNYTITVTVTGSGKKGFEVSPQSPTGTQLGTLIAGTSNHLVGGSKYVTQSSGNSSSTATWSFTWTAPTAGTGQVTFYGAFAVSQSATKLSTMVVDESSASPLAATATATPSTICAGQTAQLNASATGGSGSYTYQWSSTPAGFTSTLQNPVVSPTVSTQYNVTVSDGSGTVPATTNVSVSQPATANSGNDTTCAYAVTSIPVKGTAANYSAVSWSTSGTGTFSAPNSLNGTYSPSVADKNAGSIQLTLTAAAQSPCSVNATDSRVINFDAPTGLVENGENSVKFLVSPNPSEGKIVLQVSQGSLQPLQLTIMDLSGKEIVRQTWNSSLDRQQALDLTGMAKGLYFARISNDNFSAVQKIVIR